MWGTIRVCIKTLVNKTLKIKLCCIDSGRFYGILFIRCRIPVWKLTPELLLQKISWSNISMHEYYITLSSRLQISHTAVTDTVLSKLNFTCYTSFAILRPSSSLSQLSPHPDIYFFREGLLGTHSLVRIYLFDVLWKHQSIGIGCRAVSPENTGVKRPTQSQVDGKRFAF